MINMAMHQLVEERTAKLVERSFSEPSEEMTARAEAAVRREMDAAREAANVEELLGKLAGGSLTKDYLVLALRNEHPTILGQIARAIGLAIAPDDIDNPAGAVRYCTENNRGRDIIHRQHDGRLTCDTVIGATLMRYQPVI